MKTVSILLACAPAAVILPAPGAFAQCFVEHVDASDAAQHSHYGRHMAASGRFVVVGADLDDEVGNDAGAAYVLELVAGMFVERQKLTIPTTAYGQHFGQAVAIDGERILVGSNSHEEEFGSGAGYMYRRTASGWLLEDTLRSTAPVHAEYVGTSAALQGDRAVLGAKGLSSAEGQALVFQRTGSIWTEVDRLHPSGPETVHGFGTTVAMDGDRIVVGATFSAGGGAAYVFDLTPNGWVQTDRLVGHDAEGANGYNHGLDLEGDTIVFSIRVDPSAAYVFELVDGIWTETEKLVGSGDPLFDFGSCVDIRGDRIAVGGIDDSAFGGAEDYVEVFRRVGAGWVSEDRFTRVASAAARSFGRAVVLWRDSLLVGAPSDSEVAPSAGGVHAYNMKRRAERFCAAPANSTGASAVITVGCGSTLTELSLGAGPVPNTFGIFVAGSAQASVPLWDGVLCVGGTVIRLPAGIASGNVLRSELDTESLSQPLAFRPGTTWHLQAWFRDSAAGGTGANFSSGVSLTLGR